MSILVTGGAGFIGRHLVREIIVNAGEHVVVLDSLLPQVHGVDAKYSKVGSEEFVLGSVQNPAAVAEALSLCQPGGVRVVHLAALVGVGQSQYQPARYVAKNTLSTASFLETLFESGVAVGKIVVASSMSVYGEGAALCRKHGAVVAHRRATDRWGPRCPRVGCRERTRPHNTPESQPLRPDSVYAITKRDQEELTLVLARAAGVPAVALRFFNVYGEGQSLTNPYTGVAGIFASQLLDGARPTVYEDGLQERDFVHVSDIVSGIGAALASDVSDCAINLGTGRSVTILEVARRLGRVLAPGVEPDVLGVGRSGDVRACYADTRAAERDLGWFARVRWEYGLEELARGWVGADAADSARVREAAGELAERGLLVGA